MFDNILPESSKKKKNKENVSRKGSVDANNLDERIITLNKIALVLLIPFLKDPNFFSELLNVLQDLKTVGEDWQRNFVELNIEIFKIGNNAMTDFSLNSFKKMSKYMDKNAFMYLLEFLNSEKQHTQKFDELEDDFDEEGSGSENESD